MTKSKLFAASVLAGVVVALSGCGDPAAGSKSGTSTSTGAATSPAASTAAATGTSTGATAPASNGKPIVGWRGDGTGNFPNAKPPTEWDEKKNVKWRAMVGSSHSTPVVYGDKVFVSSDKSILTCLNRADGKQMWKKTLNAEDVPAEFKAKVTEHLDGGSQAGLSTPTPVCDGEGVYVVYGTGAIARFAMADGALKWFRYIEPVGLGYGQSSSLLLADGKLIVYLDGMAALDAQSGKTVWENKDVDKAYGSPVLMTLGKTNVIITPLASAVRVSDGKILAKDFAEDLGGDEYSISPIVQDDIVYYINRGSSAVQLTLAGDTATAKKLWSADISESAFGSPALFNGLIFSIGKTAHYAVLDAKTGKPVLMKDGKLAEDFVLELAPAGGQAQEMGNANCYPSVSIAGKNVYLSNDQGQTFVLEATKDYKEIKRNQLPEGSGGSLTFDGNELFIRGGDYLYCVVAK